ncbi:hypothetical protein P389DRAFT_172634 [Cystobasidium minutum MCA 4210]|uniref:uncharacterized protein n=1 Tax=Cystobasidium minutum MCA 4210 TaxID=1397322 RepID=UPI0034CD20BC|eukprot:jgi/Rhomi1/172634/fgenesh1_kg.5_\
MALRLPATDTALFCKRHKDESDIIPAGEAAGYPSATGVDWKNIVRRIHRDIISDLMNIVARRSNSSFYEEVCKEWEAQGTRKMNNLRNQYSTFYLELPGYYGHMGFQTILNALTAAFVSKGILTADIASPLTVEVYLRRVLVPETAVRLIQVDQRCPRSKALTILADSRDYGAAVFGDMDTASSLHFKESQIERHMRVEEELTAATQRENLLSSQGDEAEALRMGEAILSKLRKLSA